MISVDEMDRCRYGWDAVGDLSDAYQFELSSTYSCVIRR
jgi:hypothetical protein